MIKAATKNKFFWAIVGWCLLLFVLSVQPEHYLLYLVNKSVFPIAHVIAYSIFAFGLSVHFRLTRRIGKMTMDNLNLSMIVMSLIAIVGALTEIIQIYVPSRTPGWDDFACDMGGAFLGLFFFFLFSRSKLGSSFLMRKFAPSSV